VTFECVGDLDDYTHCTAWSYRLGVEAMGDGWAADVSGPDGRRITSANRLSTPTRTAGSTGLSRRRSSPAAAEGL
jgi:hypothetical protein